MTGSRPINLEKEWDDVESFVRDLRAALDEEAKTIRETELDSGGEVRSISVRVLTGREKDDCEFIQLDAFVDRLGRVFLPPKPEFEHAETIEFLDETNGGALAEIRHIVQLESRYKGNTLAAYVAYLPEE